MKSYIITALLSFILGGLIFFFIGRSTIQNEVKTQYLKGETIIGSVSNNKLAPMSEVKPDKPILPTKNLEIQYNDTGCIKYIYQVVDTSAIIEDYILKRSYDLKVFDTKTLGELKLYPTIQYNKLTSFDYDFTPMEKQTTGFKLKVLQPFASASYSTLNYIGIGGGVFYHKIGIEYQHQRGIFNNDNGHLFGLKYKF
ncbi:hypothetical protein [Dysgonomonas sp. ZJ279]|uniref:hypothetical protein n=1 Tax=Dysgonomonas sp. ZJ279 TaxID=2709796 RepID=UPI0013ED3A57|nr:hypothetical protein [Dysgonomonas sp. ZJ279]